jgi:hypothetical protein
MCLCAGSPRYSVALADTPLSGDGVQNENGPPKRAQLAGLTRRVAASIRIPVVRHPNLAPPRTPQAALCNRPGARHTSVSRAVAVYFNRLGKVALGVLNADLQPSEVSRDSLASQSVRRLRSVMSGPSTEARFSRLQAVLQAKTKYSTSCWSGYSMAGSVVKVRQHISTAG